MDTMNKQETSPLCCQSLPQEQCCLSDKDSGASAHAQPNAQLLECQKELQDWREKFLRATADFENFKRRAEKERATWVQTSQAELLLKILPIVDDVDRAFAEYHKTEQAAAMESWITGFSMIAKALHKFLATHEVVEITDIATFNPERHEAIVSVEAPDKKSGDVVEVLQKGYLLKGELLRPAQVSVAK